MQQATSPHAADNAFVFDGEFAAQYLSAPDFTMQNGVQEHHSDVYQDSYAPTLRGCDSYPDTQPTFEMPSETAINIPLGFVLPPHLQTLDMGYQQPNHVTQSQLLQADPRTHTSYSSYPCNDSIDPFSYRAPNIVAPEWTPSTGFASSLQDSYQQPFNPVTHPIDSSLSNTVHSGFSADAYYSGTHQIPTRHRDREVPLPSPISVSNAHDLLAQPSPIRPDPHTSFRWLSEHEGPMRFSELPPPAASANNSASSSIPVVQSASSLSAALESSPFTSTIRASTGNATREMTMPTVPTVPSVPVRPLTALRRHSAQTVTTNAIHPTRVFACRHTSKTGIGSDSIPAISTARSVQVTPPTPLIPSVRPAPEPSPPLPSSSDHASSPSKFSNATDLRSSMPPPSTIPSPKRKRSRTEAQETSPLTTFPTPSELLSSNGNESASGSGAMQAKAEVDKTMETTQRKQRLRLISDAVGFMPTDSDTISSHDKKRNYLECLEIYIGYLEDQMKIVKLQSPAIAKIMKTDLGMNNRSLRTLLVFMQKKLRELHQEVLKEEEKFLNLTKEVIALEQDNIRNGRDRSIACTKLLSTEGA